MTSPGGRYSAGTAILDVVPVFKGVQKAIAKEVREMERALGKDAGEEFGKQFEDSAVKAVDKALGTTKASAKKSGGEAAQEYAGQFASRFSDTMRRVQREMGTLKLDAQFDDKKLQNQFNALRRDIEDLSKKKIGIDMDAGPAMIEVDRLDAKLRQMRDKSVDLNVRTSLGAATAAVETFRKQIQRDAEIEVEVELKADRSLGLFEKTIRRRIESALQHFPPIEFNANVTPAQEKLMEIRERMIALGDKRIGVDIKADKALRDIEVLRRELATIANDETVTVQVRADAAGAAKDLLGVLAISKLVDDTKVDIEVKVEGDKKAQSGLMGLRARLLGAGSAGEEGAAGMRSFNIAILSGAALLPGLVPGIFALAGGLALLGPIALGAGAGLAVMGIGFSGVGDAVKALGKVQDNAGKDAEAAAKRIRAASRSVEDAQRSLQRAEESGAQSISQANQRVSDAREDAARRATDAAEEVNEARENVARVAERTARQVADAIENQEDAERELIRAQEEVVRAQEAVDEARERARDRIENLALSIRGGALAEQEAVLDLAEARREYEAALGDPDATAEDRQRLLIDLQQQELSLERLRLQNERLGEEQTEVARTGVEGSEEVRGAQDRVRDAQENVAAAQERVGDAVRAVSDAVTQGQAAQAEASERVVKAVENQQRVQADSAKAIADAVAAQSQAQADAARAVEDAQRNLQQAQEDYTTAVGETSASVEALEVAMANLGPAGQEFARFWFDLLPQFREMRDLVQAGMFPGLQEAISDILTVNGPLLREFMGNMGTTLGDLFRQFGDMMTSPQWMGIWRTFSEYAPIFMQQFGEVALAMLTFFGELFQGLAPYSERFGEALVRLTESSAAWMATFTESQTFLDIMDWLFTHGPTIFNHFWDIARAAGALLVALWPLGELILGIVGHIADWIIAMDPAVLGAIVTAILGLVVAFQLASLAASAVYAAWFVLNAPISGFIFLAAAAVTALIILYTQSETFRDIVDAVFRAVGAVITWLWEYVIQPVIGWIMDLFALWWDSVVWRWENIGRPMFEAIADVAEWLWDILVVIWDALGVAWEALVVAMKWVWDNILNPVWEAIKGAAQILFAFLTVVIFGPLILAWQVLAELFSLAWNEILKPTWETMKEAGSALLEWLAPIFETIGEAWDAFLVGMRWVYDEILYPYIIRPFMELLDELSTAFRQAVDSISTIWDELREALAMPINFVIETILNDGLFGAFNWIVDSLSLPEDWKIKDWDPISVNGSIPRLATGGKVPGWSPNDKADNVPAMLTAGEWVQPVSTVNYYGADVMEAIRTRRIPREAFQYLAEGGPVYQQLFSAVKKKFPRAKMNSGLRSTRDLHGAGLAVDLGEEGFAGGRGRPYLASMANTLYDTAKPFIAELIYTGAGDARPDVKNGADLNYGGPTNAAHMNHVHLAVRNIAGFLRAFGSGEILKGSMDLASPWESITGVFSHLKDSIVGPIKTLASKLGDSALGKILGGMPGKAVDWLWDKAKSSVGAFFDMLDQSNGGDNAAVDAVVNNGQVQDIVKSVAARYGWDRGGEWNALTQLIQKESGWNPKAQNPTSTAYGLFQFLNGTWAGTGVAKTGDPAGQAQAGLKYIMDRYGSPSKAWAFHNRNNWYSEGGEVTPAVAASSDTAPTLYDTGGWLPPGITTVLNATNRPEPILTGQQWNELVNSRGATDYSGGAGGIEHLHLHEVQADLSQAVGAVNHVSRVMRRGGRYVAAEVGSN